MRPPTHGTVQITLPVLSNKTWLISGSAVIVCWRFYSPLPLVPRFPVHHKTAEPTSGFLAEAEFVAVLPMRVLVVIRRRSNYVADGLVEAAVRKSSFSLHDMHTTFRSRSAKRPSPELAE